jgi:hypothetical protein
MRTAIIVFEATVTGIQALNIVSLLTQGGRLGLGGAVVGLGLAVLALTQMNKDEAKTFFRIG